MSRQVTPKTKTVRVITSPDGAWIWKKDDRSRHSLGRAPVMVDLPYEQVKTRLNPWSWAIPAASGAVCAGGIWLLADSGSGELDARKGGGLAMALFGGGVAAVSALLNILYLSQSKETIVAPPTTIGAALSGYEPSWFELTAPEVKDPLRFMLKAEGPRPEADPARPGPATRAIVAVFGVEDVSGRLSLGDRRVLTDYLGVQLAADGRFRLVPPDQVRKRLIQRKRESYRDCYDEACQIELGQALAADKILTCKVLRLDGGCRVTAVLYDLKAEATDSAVSVPSACGLSALTDAMERVVQGLNRRPGALEPR